MANKNKNPEVRFKGFTEDWEEDFIGSFYDFKNGLNKGKEYFGYGKPIVNFTDVFHKRGLLTKELKGKVDVTRDEIKNYSVQIGDLFFTRTSETIDEIGQPSVMLDNPKDAVFSGFVLRARPIHKDPLEIGFKQYAFYTDFFRSEMTKKSSMTTRALTSGTAIKKMIFSFPKSKIEQKQIGTFFQNLEKLISHHQKKHDKLVVLKKAMLEKMFPSNGATVPKVRFKGFTGDWEEKPFGEFALVKRGLTYSPSDVSNKGVKVLRSSNIYEDTFIEKEDDVYVREEAINIEFAKNKDILITSANGSSRLVGKHAIIDGLNGKAVHGGFMLIVRSKTPYFLNASMSSSWYRKFISVNVSGGNGAIGNLKASDFEEQKILIPNEDEQQKIGNYFQNLDNQLALHKSQLEKLKNIKKACFTKMFIAQD
ncbi:type I restriction enzyme, S subunit [Formosa sp. Hel1_31_208]|uniref:restriction endonuclease subunit S n=1 Tax=Formosa sp. Hel1_31_208 TaxID=1798225 RepID=UPI00087AA665|nr:restriction endonuclease subunit S [Formosa sp. Hel1_31_208]SDR88484.1 type I restriction enzyme, S subunit [Formosa sp. Hel1_31_208]